MKERTVVYDKDVKKLQDQGQVLNGFVSPNQHIALSNSMSAIIGHMVSATEGFDICNPKHVQGVEDAYKKLMQSWFEEVLKAQATLGREKIG